MGIRSHDKLWRAWIIDRRSLTVALARIMHVAKFGVGTCYLVVILFGVALLSEVFMFTGIET